jgi:hypothetical protein
VVVKQRLHQNGFCICNGEQSIRAIPPLVLCSSHRRSGTGLYRVQSPKEEVAKPFQPRVVKVRGPVFVQTRFPFKIAWFKCLVGPQEWIQGSPFSGDMHSESLPRQTPASTVNQYNTNRRSLLPLAIPSGPSRSKILQLDLDSSRMGRKTIQKQT